MHSTPANFAFGRQTFPVILGDFATLPKSRGNLFRPVRITDPTRSICRRIDSDDAVGPDSYLPQFFGNSGRLPDLFDKAMLFLWVAHRGSSPGGRPNRRHYRTNGQVFRSKLVGELLQLVVRRIDTNMGVRQE